MSLLVRPLTLLISSSLEDKRGEPLRLLECAVIRLGGGISYLRNIRSGNINKHYAKRTSLFKIREGLSSLIRVQCRMGVTRALISLGLY